MSESSAWIFVYGTLKRGLCRSWALAGQRFVAVVQTQPHYRMYNCGEYPGLVRSANGISIQGELWEVDAACLKLLDQVEGVAEGQYRREAIQLAGAYAGYPAEAYFYERPTLGLADCGPLWQ